MDLINQVLPNAHPASSVCLLMIFTSQCLINISNYIQQSPAEVSLRSQSRESQVGGSTIGRLSPKHSGPVPRPATDPKSALAELSISGVVFCP